MNTDLVAAEAKYHQNCLNKFNLPVSRGKKSGRPENVAAAMEKIFSFLENNEDSQFTLNELKEVVSDYLPDNKTIKKKLEEKYGDRIIITTKKTGFTIISFRETHMNILNQAWYEKKIHPNDERRRLLNTSADILRQDIHTKIYETDFYPPSTSLFNDLDEDIPETLIFFVEKLLLKKTKEI